MSMPNKRTVLAAAFAAATAFALVLGKVADSMACEGPRKDPRPPRRPSVPVRGSSEPHGLKSLPARDPVTGGTLAG